MGCKKLTYYQPETPLKVVYRKTEPQQKVVQRFLSIDPLAEKYYSISNYAFVANNPIRFFDPDGAKIDSTSQKDWNRLTKSVEKKRDRLQKKIDRRESKGKSISALTSRVGQLSKSLSEFDTMESDENVTYKLNNLGSNVSQGFISMDETGAVVINYLGTTSNFVHEAKHGAQYLSGDLDFPDGGGFSYLNDLYDEVSAYKAEFAYSGYMSVNSVNASWVYKLHDPQSLDNPYPYQAAHYSQYRVDKNTPTYMYSFYYPKVKFDKSFINSIPIHLRLMPIRLYK